MGSWRGQWIECSKCRWGSDGGRDHYDIDDIDDYVILCRWCFQVPDPPYWTLNCNTQHFLERMKLLPNCLQHTDVTGLIADYLCMNLLV